MRAKFFLLLFCIIFLSSISATLNVSLSDQGTDAKVKSTGAVINSGNLEVTIYDALTGGNLIYNETFTGVINNGTWNVMLGENSSNPLSLEFGKLYYKDYKINGQDLDFTNLTGGTVERKFFYSPLGDIGGEDINQNSNLTIANLSITNNISASSGLFSWLGSLTSRIAELFIQNISFIGNINGSGNITTTGRIGIGTEYPSNALDVRGQGNFSGTIYINNATDITIFNDTIIINSVNITANIQNLLNTTGIYSTYNSTYDAGIKSIVPIWINDSFQTKLNLSYPQFVNISGVMYVNSTSGRVGIGTSAPSHTLDVVGDLNVTGTSYLGNIIISADNITTNNILNKSQDNVRIWSKLLVDNNVGIGTSSPTGTLSVNSSNALGSLRVYNTTGSEHLFVNGSSGRVGIGTNNPQATLDVEGIGEFQDLRVGGVGSDHYIDLTTAGSAQMVSLKAHESVNYLWATGNNLEIRVANGYNLIFKNNGASREIMRIADNNNVGIGTTSPTEKLMVNGSLRIQNSSGTLALYVNESTGRIGIGTTTPSHKLNVVGDLNVTGTSYLGNIIISADNITTNNIISKSGNISFFNSTNSEIVRFTDDGRVGIGTSSPTEKLTVNGNVSLNNTLYVLGNGDVRIRTTGSANTNTFIVNGSMTIGKGVGGSLEEDNDAILGLSRSATAGYNMLIFQTGSSTTDSWAVGMLDGEADFVFDTSYGSGTGKRLVIQNATGNIGIGTTSPTEKLMVNGSFRVQNSSGTLALYVNDSTGNVGIGTTSPEGKLHVYTLGANYDDIGGSIILNRYLVGGSWRGGAIFSVAPTGSQDVLAFALSDDTTPLDLAKVKMVIRADGKVGIGTTNPTGKLDIEGTDTGAGTRISINNTVGKRWHINSGNDGLFKISQTGILDAITIQNQTGNVGIGTTSPGAKQTVLGGDVYVASQGNGIILKDSSNGNCHRLTVSGGALSLSVAIACPAS